MISAHQRTLVVKIESREGQKKGEAEIRFAWRGELQIA
jgi:hypothetical protein